MGKLFRDMIAKVINNIFAAGYKRVIVPGFGAFIKRSTGETIFTDMLSEDDGVLIASLIGSGLNAAESRQAVDKFVMSLRSEIALNGRAAITGIGILTKNTKSGYDIVIESSDTALNGSVTETTHTIEEATPEPHNDKSELYEKPTVTDLDLSALHDSDLGVKPDNNISTQETDISPEEILEEVIAAVFVNKAVQDEGHDTVNDKVSLIDEETETEKSAEDFIHPSFAKKAKLRSALYGDIDGKKESDAEQETLIFRSDIQNNKQTSHGQQESAHTNKPHTQESLDAVIAITSAQEIVEGASDESNITGNAAGEHPQKYPDALESDKENVLQSETTNEPYKTTSLNSAQNNTSKSPQATITASDQSEPYKPQINIRRPAKSKKRVDGVMVVAIIALVITLGIIVYGYLAERDINLIRGEEEELYIEMEQQVE